MTVPLQREIKALLQEQPIGCLLTCTRDLVRILELSNHLAEDAAATLRQNIQEWKPQEIINLWLNLTDKHMTGGNDGRSTQLYVVHQELAVLYRHRAQCSLRS